MRNHVGQHLMPYAGQINALPAVEAEIMTLHDGLILADRYGLMNLSLKGDRSYIMGTIYQWSSLHLMHTWKRIKKMLKQHKLWLS